MIALSGAQQGYQLPTCPMRRLVLVGMHMHGIACTHMQFHAYIIMHLSVQCFMQHLANY